MLATPVLGKSKKAAPLTAANSPVRSRMNARSSSIIEESDGSSLERGDAK